MATKTRDYLPASESDFSSWANHFATTIGEHAETYELSEAQVGRLRNSLDRWNDDFAGSIAARDAAKAAVRRKDEARTAFTEEIRSVAGMIQSNRNVSDAARDAAGLPIHKTNRTPIAPPRSAPFGMAIASARYEITLMLSDITSPTRRSRPAGVSGCEVFISYDQEAPVSPDRYAFFKYCSRTVEAFTFGTEHGGQPVHLLARWVNPTGKPGPWSEPISTTVPSV